MPALRDQNMLNHAANAGTHTYADRGFDLYATPTVALEALLRVEQLVSDGSTASLSEIWTLNYMPPQFGSRRLPVWVCKTIREIIRNTYNCKSREEEDYFLARWIAS
jgi:hypothetical protein